MYFYRIVFIVQSTLFCLTHCENHTSDLNSEVPDGVSEPHTVHDIASKSKHGTKIRNQLWHIKSYDVPMASGIPLLLRGRTENDATTSNAQGEVLSPRYKPNHSAVKRTPIPAETYEKWHKMTQEVLEMVKLVSQTLNQFDLSILNSRRVKSIVIMKQELKNIELQLSDMETDLLLKTEKIPKGTPELDEGSLVHPFKVPLPKRMPDPVTYTSIEERADRYKDMQSLADKGENILEVASGKLLELDRSVLDIEQLERLIAIIDELQKVKKELINLHFYLFKKEGDCYDKLAAIPDAEAGPKHVKLAAIPDAEAGPKHVKLAAIPDAEAGPKHVKLAAIPDAEAGPKHVKLAAIPDAEAGPKHIKLAAIPDAEAGPKHIKLAAIPDAEAGPKHVKLAAIPDAEADPKHVKLAAIPDAEAGPKHVKLAAIPDAEAGPKHVKLAAIPDAEAGPKHVKLAAIPE